MKRVGLNEKQWQMDVFQYSYEKINYTSTARLVSLLQTNIATAVDRLQKLVIYVCAGACDLTSKFMYLRHPDHTSVDNICIHYRRLIDIVHSYRQIIKFIDVPTLSIQKYNQTKCHKNPSSFQEAEASLDRQVIDLNSRILDINSSIGHKALRFSAFLHKRRKDTGRRTRFSYHFEHLYDGVHACKLLNTVWLQKLTLDIQQSFSNVPAEDILNITVSDSELASLQ